MDIDVTKLTNICVGLMVDIVAEEDKDTQEVTRGCVMKILSSKDNKKGIRVQLTNGQKGRVIEIPSRAEIKKETFKFYNILFHQNKIFSIWDKKNNKFLIINRKNKLSGKLENLILLFSDDKTFKSFVSGTSLDNKDYVIRPITRKKAVVEVFKDYNVDYFSIDGNRKLSFKKMKELEEYFKRM